jgi:hypothetical protein
MGTDLTAVNKRKDDAGAGRAEAPLSGLLLPVKWFLSFILEFSQIAIHSGSFASRCRAVTSLGPLKQPRCLHPRNRCRLRTQRGGPISPFCLQTRRADASRARSRSRSIARKSSARVAVAKIVVALIPQILYPSSELPTCDAAPPHALLYMPNPRPRAPVPNCHWKGDLVLR